ncbi:MAG: DUF2911 domain-containing protein [Bacteroidota bacterium]
MKTYISLFILCLLSLIASAQLRTPSLSPTSTLTQKIGLTEIEIEYSRPSARDRSIFAEEGLIPFGEFWRAGANSATKISFSSGVSLAGENLEAGSYSILIKPYPTYWELHFYPFESTDWTKYVEKEASFVVKPEVSKSSAFIESFEIQIQDLDLHTASLVFEWENSRVKVPVELNDEERVMASIKRTLSGPGMFDYYNAAVYLHASNTDLEKALEYIQEVTRSDKALFFQVSREAQILYDLNRKDEALLSAKRALRLAQKANNQDFIRFNTKLIQKLE